MPDSHSQAFTDMLAALESLIKDGDFYSDSIYFNDYDGIAVKEHMESIIAKARKEIGESLKRYEDGL